MDPSAESLESSEKSDLAVDFRNVTFTYPSRRRKAVLRDLNLRVKRGQVAALVGASGCGKTTVISLLERFYEIDSGQLFVYNQPVSKFPLEEYRQTLSLVSQEPVLFRGTALLRLITHSS
jgi:ATP-binding cassette, subfamily B (MDR/TAP), member 1